MASGKTLFTLCWLGCKQKKLDVQLREVEVQEDSMGGGAGMPQDEQDEDDDGRRFLLVMKDVTGESLSHLMHLTVEPSPD